MAQETGESRTPRSWASTLFNDVWTELGRTDRRPEDDDRMVHMAHASRFHWGEIGGSQESAIGEWQCSRVYAALGRFEPSLHHAERCLVFSRREGVEDWVEASAYEAIARAYAVGNDAGHSRLAREKASELAAAIRDKENRAVVLADIESLPAL